MTTKNVPEGRAVEEYLKLPYTIRVTPDPTGGFVADAAELPGCITQGDTWEELGAMVEDAMRGWIALRLDDGRPVPVPQEEAPPAKMLVRLPRSLHEDLAAAAAREGVSLNQFVIYQLALVMGRTAWQPSHHLSVPDALQVVAAAADPMYGDPAGSSGSVAGLPLSGASVRPGRQKRKRRTEKATTE